MTRLQAILLALAIVLLGLIIASDDASPAPGCSYFTCVEGK